MSCVISIIGKNLDIDNFVLQSKIKGFIKRYKGDLIVPSNPNSKKLLYSYISKNTSKDNFDDLKTQIKNTINFLRKNKENLELINKTKEVEFATIDFGLNLQIDNEIILCQNLYFPKELIELCGYLGIGIEVSVYSKEMDNVLEKRNKR